MSTAADYQLRVANATAAKNLFSPLLWKIATKYGTTLEEIQLYDGNALDSDYLAAIKGSALVDTDLLGINFLNRSKRLALHTVGSLYAGLVNITGFTELTYIRTVNKSGATANIIVGDVSNLLKIEYFGESIYPCSCANLVGTFANLTTLKVFNTTFTRINDLYMPVLPKWGNNPNLQYVSVGGDLVAQSQNTDIGDLANCTQLSYFKLNPSTKLVAAVGNYILQRLLVQKQAGGAIATIYLNCTITDTTTKNALISAGVSVTTT